MISSGQPNVQYSHQERGLTKMLPQMGASSRYTDTHLKAKVI